MSRGQSKSILKHLDFMVIDFACMQLCFIISYWINEHFANPYVSERFRYIAIVIVVSQLIVTLISSNYQGILRRGKLDEAIAVCKYAAEIFLLVVIYLFLVQQSVMASRMQIGCMFLFYLLFDYILRRLNKARIFKYGSGQKKSLIVITSSNLFEGVVKRLSSPKNYHDYIISGIMLLDKEQADGVFECSGKKHYSIPITHLDNKAIDEITHDWVDEVFILQPEGQALPPKLMDDLLEMGMTVNYVTESMAGDRWPVTDVRKIGGYRVFTSSIRLATLGQAALKRAADIIGALIGCLLTCVLFIFVAPAIYAKSPGPIFFKQERVGRNGKVFNMYKFRSMYLDAEERKSELMKQNKMHDDMMFKMDNDPRIIGGERKNAKGKARGIGNFIRRTSIDEFPQFFNVLKGEMSLVGTRPPTLAEWEKYDLGHRVRMSIKPGITGLWQVSGRSAVTSFQDVVRFDRTYIETWSPMLDVKILLKTIIVVVKGEGAL